MVAVVVVTSPVLEPYSDKKCIISSCWVASSSCRVGSFLFTNVSSFSDTNSNFIYKAEIRSATVDEWNLQHLEILWNCQL